MRLFTITFFCLLIGFQSNSQNCLFNGITLTTQGAIDSFQINFPDCEIIGGNVIIANDDIQNLEGLSQVREIDGILRIANTQLTNMEGLNALENVRGLFVSNNSLLENMVGLSALENIGSIGLELEENPVIENLTGMNALRRIEGPFFCSLNGLVNFEGLGSLTNIDGDFQILRNDNLTTCQGLERLEVCGDGFLLKSNTALQSFTGVNRLHTIINGFWVDKNTSLVNFEGLDALTEITNFVRITDNTSLVVCSHAAVCSFLQNPGANISVTRNAVGCNNEQEITSNCATSSTENIDNPFEINIFPNPSQGEIFLTGNDLDNARVTISNSVGKVVLIENFSTQQSINLPNDMNGLLFVKIEKEEQVVIKKILSIR